MNLAGASIALDDCYEVWESGFISIPYDFQLGDIEPQLQRMLGSTSSARQQPLNEPNGHQPYSNPDQSRDFAVFDNLNQYPYEISGDTDFYNGSHAGSSQNAVHASNGHIRHAVGISRLARPQCPMSTHRKFGGSLARVRLQPSLHHLRMLR